MRNIFTLAGLLIREIFRKKDFYVALIFTGVVLLYAANMRFYNVGNAYRYLLDIGLGLGVFFAAMLTVTLAARQYPSEIQNKTCQVLLSKPVSRAEFVMGKFIGSFAAGSACLAVFFAVLMFFAFSKTQDLSMAAAVQTFYLFCLGLAILAAMAVCFSFFMTAAANALVTLILYFFISLYGVTMSQSARALHFINLLVPHFGFFDMRQRFIHGWPPVSAKLLLFLSAYAGFYSAIFLLCGWLVFRRKNIL